MNNTHERTNFAGIVWEMKGERTYLRALVITCKNVLLHPVSSFSQMHKNGALMKPLSFAVIMVAFGRVGSAFWRSSIFANHAEITTSDICMDFLLGLTIVLIFLFTGSGLIHLFVVLFNCKDKSFSNTFRVIAYSTSTQILYVLPPLILIPVLFVWNTIIQILGIREVFQISTKRAVLIICCSFGAGGLVFTPISFWIYDHINL